MPPRLTIVAGANGSGKSTFTADSRFLRQISLLDPDAIGAALQPTIPGTTAVAAARQVLNEAKEHIRKGVSLPSRRRCPGKDICK